MSNTLPKIVTPGVVRNLLKQNFKLRIPSDARNDVSPKTINLVPGVDVEIDYRDFKHLLEELRSLERKRVILIVRYPETESGVVGVEQDGSLVLAKTSFLNFKGSLKATLGDTPATVDIDLDLDPVNLGNIIVDGGSLYYYDEASDLWLSSTEYTVRWSKVGTSNAKIVELGEKYIFSKEARITRLDGFPSPTTFQFIHPVSRSLLISSASFYPVTVEAGSEILPVRTSPTSVAVINPSLTMYYREILNV